VRPVQLDWSIDDIKPLRAPLALFGCAARCFNTRHSDQMPGWAGAAGAGGTKTRLRIPFSTRVLIRKSWVQIAGLQPPAGKQAARVPLRNRDLKSAMAPIVASSFGSRPQFRPRPIEAVRCIRLGTCGAWCRSRMLPSRTRDMGNRRSPWARRETGPPEPPSPSRA